jgi:hypothetical protein
MHISDIYSALGYVSTKCLCAAVELKIPDILEKAEAGRNGCKGLSATELASESNARAERLAQVMRVLHNNGIFAYDETSETYSNNATSTLLLTDHWTQWHNWIDLYGNEFYDMARGIPASVRKDATRSPAQIEFNTDEDMFTHFQARGWLPRLHRTLGGGAIAQAPGILEDYPWEEVAEKTVIDIGGGSGSLIVALLRKYKTMRGGIFDLKSVIDHIGDFFYQQDGKFADVAGQMQKENLIAGDFFKEVHKSEVYIMKWVLHDWNDEDSIKILRNIRKAIIPGPASRLIILESILSDGRMGRLSRYGDINMMIAAGGQERTEKQWRNLAAQTGWKIEGIHYLRRAWPCAIDLRPIDCTV